MDTRLKVLMRCFRTGRIVDSLRVLAVEVRGEHRMDSAAVNMTLISMTMISLGMHVKEWNHQHPYGRPHEDQHPRIGWLVVYLSHCALTLAQIPCLINQPISLLIQWKGLEPEIFSYLCNELIELEQDI